VYRYAAGKVDWLSAGLPSEGELANELRIRDIVHREIATCRLGQRIGDVQTNAELCVVLNDAGIIMGDLRGAALRADPSTPVEQVMDPGVSTYRPNISVHEIAHHLLESGAQRVLVSDADGRLIGWISRQEAERALDEHRHHHDGPVLAFSGKQEVLDHE
jgi:CBS-domain-containing membrane protein